jgi:hypothetical protein
MVEIHSGTDVGLIFANRLMAEINLFKMLLSVQMGATFR